MAIGTVRGIFVLIVMSLSVTTFKVHIENFGMTGGAVHRQIGGAWTLQMFGDCGMALGTLDVLVD
jgi:hypothetical protein